MTTVLGIDAAWTATQPSGVALVQKVGMRWSCRAVAPSYGGFGQASRGGPVDWRAPAAASTPDVEQLLAAATRLAGHAPDVVAVDMPVSTVEIMGRRTADSEVSRRFGAQGCSTHSPSTVRPGPLGAALSRQLEAAGFELATTVSAPGTTRKLLEVYPHPALLALLNRNQRVPYKVSKSSKYWHGASLAVRIEKLLAEFNAILNGLSAHIDDIPLQLPRAHDVESLSSLKRYEDGIDALVCCWVGCQYLDGRAVPLGDATGAIWCPV